jgi:hypothetical protein
VSQLRRELDHLVATFVTGIMDAIGETRLEQLVEPEVIERAKQVARKSVVRRRGTHSVCPPPSPATTADSAPSRPSNAVEKGEVLPRSAKPKAVKGPRYVVEAPDGTVLSGHDDVTPALRANNADAKAMRVRRMVDGEVVSSKRTSEVIKPTESPW